MAKPIQYYKVKKKNIKKKKYISIYGYKLDTVADVNICIHIYQFSSVQSFSCVLLFATWWTAAHQASLSITNFKSLLKLMSVESEMPSNHLFLCCALLLLPQSFPASGSFPRNQFLASGGQSTGVSALASVFPMNIQA